MGLSFQGAPEPPRLKHIMCFVLFYTIRGRPLGLIYFKPDRKGAEIRLLCPLESLYGGIISGKKIARGGKATPLGAVQGQLG